MALLTPQSWRAAVPSINNGTPAITLSARVGDGWRYGETQRWLF
jgi:hypothetical protein